MTPRHPPAIILTAVLDLWLAAEGSPLALSAEDETELATATIPPRASPRLGPRVERKLGKAFRIAIAQLHQNSACRELFSELEKGGVEALRNTIYVPVRRGLETRICETGVVAYTEVGSAVTRLCPRFGQLVEGRAAITLIHEGLHSAGLGEKPVDPNGPTSDQITRRVTRACQ